MKIMPGYTPDPRDFNNQRLRIGGPDRSWPPPMETYCTECRRMVEARPYGGGLSDQVIPARHFRTDISGQHDHRVCQGVYRPSSGVMQPGMEDPVAGFYFSSGDFTRAITRGHRKEVTLKLWST